MRKVSTPPPAGAGTIVLVDDEPALLRAFARILEKRPEPIETFTSARDAIDRVARGGVSVVVSDISMPEMSGIELLRSMREHDADLPIVLVTGTPAIESATDAVEYGAFKYVVKPVDGQALRAVVDRAAKFYRLARTRRQALGLLGIDRDAADGERLETDFESALAAFWIAFQPIVHAAAPTVFGYEALFRSEAPSLPSPGHVIEAAERLGQLDRLGRAIRNSVVHRTFLEPDSPSLFVNLHPRDLADPELLDAESPLVSVAEKVVLEITERASLDELENVRKTVARLRERGFRIAIDDLGAGYAGLTSFALLEPEIVKLDMTLVRDIDQSPVKQRLVRSMTEVCRDMGMLIVAEGIETFAERDALLDIGCDLLQGYLIARPGRPFPVPSWDMLDTRSEFPGSATHRLSKASEEGAGSTGQEDGRGKRTA